MSFFGVNQQMVLSTEVAHCIACNFTSKDDNNLILARSSVIQIYILKQSNVEVGISKLVYTKASTFT